MAFFLVGCTDYDYRISRMPCRTLSYNQLPKEEQRKLVDFSCHLIEEKNRMLLCDNNDSNKYQTEEIPFIVGIDYIKLIDTSNNLVYRIEQGTPSPFIIYKDKLYIPNKYLGFCNGDYRLAKYREYVLK